MRRAATPLLSAIGLLVPGMAFAQKLGTGSAPEVSFVRITAAMLLCFAAAAAAAVLLIRRRGINLPAFGIAKLSEGLAGRRRIEVLESRRISLHADVCLMRCDGREYLILTGQSGTRVLSRSERVDATGTDEHV